MSDKKSAFLFATGLSIVLLFFYAPFLLGWRSFYFTDTSFYLEPHCRFIVDAVRAGGLPLWNPLNYCGMPQVAVTFPSFFYLPTLLFLVLPFNTALALSMVLHQVLSGLGMYLLVRSCESTRLSAVTAGLIYSLTGYMFALSSNHTLVAGAAWCPLALFFLRRIESDADSAKLGSAYGATMICALSIFMLLTSGRPEVSVPGAGLLVAYLVVCGWLRFKEKQQLLNPGLTWQLRALFLGFVFALPAILPAAQWLSVSRRAVGLQLKEVFFYSATWFDVLSMIIGPALGDLRVHAEPLRALAMHDLSVPYISCAYLGPVAITLSLWGAFDKRWRYRFLVLSVLVFGIVLSMGRNTPVMPFLVDAVPSLSFVRFPIKLLFLPVGCASILAARGLWLCSKGEKVALSSFVFWLLAGLASLVLFLVSKNGQVVLSFGHQHEAATLLLTAQSMIASSGFYATAVGLTISAIAYGGRRNLYSGRITSVLLLSALCFSLMLNACLYEMDGAEPGFYEKPSCVNSSIQKLLDKKNGRIVDLYLERLTVPPSYLGTDPRHATHAVYQYNRQILKSNTYFDFNVPSAYGFEGAMRGDYHHLFLESYFKSSQSLQERDSPLSDLPLARFCRLTSTHLALTQAYRRVGKFIEVPILDPQYFQLLEENQDMNFRIYKVLDSPSRAYFTTSFRYVDSGNQVIKEILESESKFDPSKETLIEANRADPEMPDPDSPETELSEPNRKLMSKEAVQLLRDDRETIVLKVKADQKGFLILADQFYAGWEARVDGQSTPIFVANGYTRAVLVPQGEHVVEFAYRPKSLMLGICLALLGGFLSIYLWFVARREPGSQSGRYTVVITVGNR
ncbi:MAG: hypothetical protein K8F91_24745 [Candidatus Obscuribacterales bacterium]|nr:hypothetical protein [Candidatus Obscuribacterales bacterium]